MQGGNFPRYASGYLTWARGGSLLSAPLDLDRLEPTGPPAVVGEDVEMYPDGTGLARFDIADQGPLVYVSGFDPMGHLHGWRRVPGLVARRRRDLLSPWQQDDGGSCEHERRLPGREATGGFSTHHQPTAGSTCRAKAAAPPPGDKETGEARYWASHSEQPNLLVVELRDHFQLAAQGPDVAPERGEKVVLASLS